MTLHEPTAQPQPPMPRPPDPRRDFYDVAIIGGAMSGAATATVILQKNPALRVLVIEKSPSFERRVGESTIEISTFFLNRVLGLADHLNEHHYVKQGLRFWFANDEVEKFDDCTEIGGRFLSRVPAFMVDRAVLDEEVLKRAVALGAELRRPAQLTKIELAPGGEQRLTIREADGREQNVRARWAVDASGVRALAGPAGRLAPPERGASDRRRVVALDRGEEFRRAWNCASKYPEWAAASYGMRHMATNHLMGEGWWSWWIPLKGGDVSIGLVYDQRLVTLPPGPSMGERLRSFLVEQPPDGGGTARKSALARGRRAFPPQPGVFQHDVRGRRVRPGRRCRRVYRPVLQPGAGLDGLHGLGGGGSDRRRAGGRDRRARSASSGTTAIIPARTAAGSRRSTRTSTSTWATSSCSGSRSCSTSDCITCSWPRSRSGTGRRCWSGPIYSLPPSTPFFYLMRFYNRRCAAMARVRRARGVYGPHNAKRRYLFGGFTFSVGKLAPDARGVGEMDVARSDGRLALLGRVAGGDARRRKPAPVPNAPAA